jgi:predicted unusual protein kinase regulating ubiquinone biosynthesis (AarF/ABC1/UbiB family)
VHLPTPSRRAVADAKQLPFDSNYDPVALEAYYSQRPLQLYARVAVVAGSIVKVAVAWARDELAPASQGVTRGKVLRDTIATMGPVFVKLGQTLSTRPDIIGQEACDACGQVTCAPPHLPVS